LFSHHAPGSNPFAHRLTERFRLQLPADYILSSTQFRDRESSHLFAYPLVIRAPALKACEDDILRIGYRITPHPVRFANVATDGSVSLRDSEESFIMQRSETRAADHSRVRFFRTSTKR
jgi:hypothetical protein